MNTPSWFRILKIIRRIKGQIHSTSLSEGSNIDQKDASAWLCKFCRWGYLKRVGKSEVGGKSVQYELTPYGKSVEAPKVSRKFRKSILVEGDRDSKSSRIAANPKETSE